MSGPVEKWIILERQGEGGHDLDLLCQFPCYSENQAPDYSFRFEKEASVQPTVAALLMEQIRMIRFQPCGSFLTKLDRKPHRGVSLGVGNHINRIVRGHMAHFPDFMHQLN